MNNQFDFNQEMMYNKINIKFGAKMKKQLKHMARLGRKMSRVSQTKKFKTKFAGFVILMAVVAIILAIPSARQYMLIKSTRASGLVATGSFSSTPYSVR